MGADFLEQDLLATSDGELVVLHDPILDDVSDVALRYPGRARDDGHYYVVDFTRAELGEINLAERRTAGSSARRFPGRFAARLPGLRVLSFAEEIHLVAELNRTTGRQVGLYPEIKVPEWHQQAGIDITALVHEALEQSCAGFDAPIFVQSFDGSALQRLVTEFQAQWPLIRLLDKEAAGQLLADPASLSRIEAYATGIGLPYQSLLDVEQGSLRPSKLAERLGESGLLVHPYTLRRDEPTPAGTEYSAVLRFLIHELGVDAVFCDYPDDAIAIRCCNAA